MRVRAGGVGEGGRGEATTRRGSVTHDICMLQGNGEEETPKLRRHH